MLRFGIGFGLVFTTIILLEVLQPQTRFVRNPERLPLRIVLVVFAPTLVALAAAVITSQFRPLRILQRKATGMFGPMRFGLILGLVVAVIIPFALVGLGRWVNEAYIPALVTAVVSIPAFTLVAPRCIPGYCARCGYDIRCSLEANRCPECGAVLMGCS
jgi:uncharacterized protein YacL